MASTLGCQGSLFNSFAQPADEAIVAVQGGTNLYRVNLSTGVVTTIAVPTIQSIALIGQDTILGVNFSPAVLVVYLIDLIGGGVRTLGTLTIPSFFTFDTIAVVDRDNVLISGSTSSGSDAYIYRLNLPTFTGSVVKTWIGLGGGATHIALENDQSAIVQLFGGNVYRLNLNDYSDTLLLTIPTNTRHLALVPNRNLALVVHQSGTSTPITRIDLNTNTPLSPLGTFADGAGEGIALENSQSVLVGNNNAAAGGLYRVDLDSGVTRRVDDGTFSTLLITDIAVRFR
ncbi:MAG: hypothetical protein IEMM0008_0948 [bacterium]|nr:MAG: hypothetical protein IEMM0008_0948 [bacterium]